MHTVLLWFVAGMGVTAFVLWLTMVAASEGDRLGPVPGGGVVGLGRLSVPLSRAVGVWTF